MSSRRQQLEATWQALGVDVEALDCDSEGTFGARADDTVPMIDEPTATRSPAGDQVELGAIIGRGGMGVVYAGRQLALEREVAVKSVRPELGDAGAAELLFEARLTGALEHPAIVPIYGVATDGDGRPMILMKHITGESWHDRIRDLGSLRDATLLEDDIGVLIQVCNAIAFAHERGVLHRDIKPANILLGDFGEVYVVDWGLALDLGHANIPGLPSKGDVNGVSGSVYYMAPEQASGVGEDLGPHTDVYLLGATLYELIGGEPVRGGGKGKPNFHKLLLAAFTDDVPALPDWVPSELREITARATAREPARRYPTVAAFRDALTLYLSRRQSRDLDAEARARLESATAALAADPDADVGRDLAAARFGFEQALRSWPNNRSASDGWQDTLLLVAQRELRERRPAVAEAALEALEAGVQTTGRVRDDGVIDNGSSDKLAVDIASLRKQLVEEKFQLAALERAAEDSDLGVAGHNRRIIGIALGISLLVAHVALDIFNRTSVVRVDHLVYLATTSAVALCFALPTFIWRKRILPNAANMRFAFTLGIMLLGQVLVFVAMWQADVALSTTLAISLIQLSGSIAIKTALLDRRVLWTSAVALTCAVIALAVPTMAIELVGLSYATYFVAGALLSWETSARGVPELIEDLRRLS